MPDDYPLAILDHRIATLRDKIHELWQERNSTHSEHRAALAERLAGLNKEINELRAERDILAAHAR